ncbi:hypothetical protein U6A24_03870 [Aquimarina gracilis]|uniref:Uncharacterized protein n=1 Tax=Aquimarina gracilis TaxID=874422 RepID=A0ABU5ZSG0_9FLAO|nr:hypothetical protein [Aquimarina gracilis]MEB3344583.1 hypothetical protein [Aquimarina gracilis]
MKLKALFTSCFLVFNCIYAQKTTTEVINDILLNLEESTNYNSLELKNKKKYKKHLFLLRDQEETEQKFNGKILFGLNGLEVDNNNLFVINTGVTISRGTYPFQFKFSSNIQAQTQNGSLKETVSNLGISFDYNVDKDINKETYVFVKRTNNSFLGIDQRYEIGGGFIFSSYSGKEKEPLQKKGLTDTGEKILRQLEGFKDNESLGKCVDEVCNINDEDPIDSKYSEILNQKKEDFIKITRKKYSQTRLSILLGLNYELEKTEDNLKLFYKDSTVIDSFPATNRFRIVVRPGFEWQGNNFTFETKAYFKFGVFGELENVVNEGSISDERLDYWAEWENSLSFKFSKKITLGIKYSYFYDNAANRKFINTSQNAESDFRIFSAEDTFQAITFNFEYKL